MVARVGPLSRRVRHGPRHVQHEVLAPILLRRRPQCLTAAFPRTRARDRHGANPRFLPKAPYRQRSSSYRAPPKTWNTGMVLDSAALEVGPGTWFGSHQ